MKKTLFFGMDGATFDLIEPWAMDGSLPLFAKLMNEGSWGKLRSTTPALTPPGWTTSFTGVNPGSHGIFDFLTFDSNSYWQRVMTLADLKAPPLWDIFNENGLGCLVFNVPLTYPAPEMNGSFISGMGTPGIESKWAYPSSLKDEIMAEEKEFSIGVSHEYLVNKDYPGFLRALYALTEIQERTILNLIKREDPSLIMVVVDDLDRLQHFFWHFYDEAHPLYQSETSGPLKDAILLFLRRIETLLSRLLDSLGDCNLCILSDHGFGPLYRDVFINSFLSEKGFVKIKSQAEPFISRLKKKIKPFVPSMVKKLRAKIYEGKQNPFGFIDFKKTLAFYASVSGRSIYLNTKERFEEGIVGNKDYDSIRDDIIGGLKELKDPKSGERVVDDVLKRENIYTGKYMETLPDLIIRENGHYAYRTEPSEILFEDATQYGVAKTGSHRPDGVLILRGSEIGKTLLKDIEITDIAPTILAWNGLPLGEHMEGKVITKAFLREPLVETRDYGLKPFGESLLTNKEESMLKNKLKDLGYM